MPDISSPFYVGSPFGARAWTQVDANAAEYYKVVENIQSFLIAANPEGWKARDQSCSARGRTAGDRGQRTSTPWPSGYSRSGIFTGIGHGAMGATMGMSYFDGCRHTGGAPGFSIMKCLWRGGGAESSARFEAMIEGLQELEARIFVEQTLDAGC